jgi:LruC domain-containing protein
MKTISSKTSLVLFSILSVLLYSCANDSNDTSSDIKDDPKFENFDFKTTKEIKVSVSTLNSENNPVSGVSVEIYTQNPLTPEGLLKENSSDFLAFKGVSSSAGKLDFEIAPPTYVDSLSVLVNQIGFPSLKQVKIDSKNLNITVGGASPSSSKYRPTSKTAADLPEPRKIDNYYVLGSWDSQGKPNYLWSPDDKITDDFLKDIDASLPEYKRLPDSHPEYLSSPDNGNIELIEDAEVWITFVHEGAGYRNAIGYYTHKNDNPPATKADIKDQTMIFPNVSYSGSGGSLKSGNKVQLLYLDPVTNKYTKVFPKGTSVAWFLIANGFNGSTTSVGSGIETYYSDTRFNPEKEASKKKHNVVLKDTERKRLLIGFEDINRGGGDEDFNDAIFYSTVTPFTAVKTDEIQPIDKSKDTDGDGVSDIRDEYPNDRTKAFNNYYPSKNNVGTLAFEDLWPTKGDYDFNDLVVDYNFNQITNGDNKIVEINAALTVRAIGASLKNGFALQFNTSPSNVKSVTGQTLNNNVFTLNGNGTEQKQIKAVIPIFDDPYKILNAPAGITNTYVGGAYSAPKTLNVKIEFVTPIATTGFTAPYNPFIVVDGIRGKEIHLAGSAPTDLVDKSKFGTGDDNSNLATQKYYMSDNNLPWAINIPLEFAYPAEQKDITKAYLMFNKWAESKGTQYTDWYLDKANYRDSSKLYKK